MRRSVRWGLFAIGAVMLLSAGETRAASFDCAKAAGRIEHMICDDIDLNMLDGQIQAAYAGALDRSLHPEQVTASQRAWLKQRDACPDQKCILAAYNRRIEILSSISDEPAICSGSTTPEVDACAKEYSRRADKELDRYVAAARKRIAAESTEEAGRVLTNETLPKFEAAQAAWLAFRKAECEAVYDYWSEGTIRGAMYEGCWQSLTKARTTQVWRTWLTYMDSTPPFMPKPTDK